MEAQVKTEGWFCLNRLLFNKGKTERVFFLMRDIEQANKDIRELKFLGVSLDIKLQWSAHVTNTAKKLIKSSLIMRNSTSCVLSEVLSTADFDIFHSHISYAFLA